MASRTTEIRGLVEKCNATLRGASRSGGPSRRAYFDALTLADRALELATSAAAVAGGGDEGLNRQCEVLQEYCRNELARACGKIVVERERSAYLRRSAADDPNTSEAAGDGAAAPSSRGDRSVSFA